MADAADFTCCDSGHHLPVLPRRGRVYYLASVLIILYTMVPFFLVFEHRKPQARELVVLAVLCAIAVASRAAFKMIDHFKPMTAIIMISGMAFGPEAGFLVGAVSGFSSNFLFGHGPWTPWQMFAFGTAGFLAGALYRLGWLSKKRLPLSLFGFFASFSWWGRYWIPARCLPRRRRSTGRRPRPFICLEFRSIASMGWRPF